jgi:hypothetical protein
MHPQTWTLDPTRILTRRELATVLADVRRGGGVTRRQRDAAAEGRGGGGTRRRRGAAAERRGGGRGGGAEPAIVCTGKVSHLTTRPTNGGTTW